MRISTQSTYDRASAGMATLSAAAAKLQTQVATGKKLIAPSDDAAAYRQLTVIRRANADQAANAANVTLASGLLASSDTALESIGNQLVQARELAMQASNGTLTDSQKASIATSLDAIVDDMLALANTTDSRGQPLFGGATGAVAYTRAADGAISFAGTGEPGAIPIGDGTSIHANDSGERIFAVNTPGGASDIFRIVQELAEAIRTGGDVSKDASSEALTTLQSAIEGVADARASVGARAARLDLEAQRLSDTAVDREESRSAIEDVDPYEAYTQLQKTLTILSATQASFSKLTSMSLFDYLR